MGLDRMRSKYVAGLVQIFAVQCLLVRAASQDFDFFYFVLQWPGSYCDTKQSCCYPLTGKPATDFGIHGLWPNYNDGSYPSNCDTSNPFDSSKVLDLISRMQTEWPSLSCPSSDNTKFWSHEWGKHGTCSESILNQYGYFKAALDLKNQIDILQILTNAGIEPNGETYSLGSIKNAIKGAIGFMPFVEFNTNESGQNQLFQIYLCVNTTASGLIECPVLPSGKCGSRIEFPIF